MHSETNGESGMVFDWAGDLVIPFIVLIVSTLFSLWLANFTIRQQRVDIASQRDHEYADEFLKATAGLYPEMFLTSDLHSAKTLSTQLNQAYNRFTSFASGTEATTLAAYLGAQWFVIERMVRRAEEAVLALPSPERNTGFAKIAIDRAISSTEKSEMGLALSNMRDIIRDWPYPEKRRDCLKIVYGWNIAIWHRPPANVDLALDQILVYSLPSRNRLVQAVRVTRLKILYLHEDWVYGRLRERFELMWISYKENRLVRPMIREEKRARKTAKKDRIELRKLYESADRYYARRQELPPWRR